MVGTKLSGFEIDKRYNGLLLSSVSSQIFKLVANKKANNDTPVAKYNLLPDQWFNDNNISYVYEYIENEFVNEKNLENEIVLFRPSMAYLLLHGEDLSSLRAVLPSLDKAKYIFLPINDNPDVEAIEGGDHWALLVVHVSNRQIYYYDSVTEANYQTAVDTSRRIASLLDSKVRLTVADTPQQENGSDCGVLVCQITVLLVGRIISELCNAKTHRESYLDDQVLNIKEINLSATMGRTVIMATILDLMKKSEGRL